MFSLCLYVPYSEVFSTKEISNFLGKYFLKCTFD
jgi:hypothetical protein